MGRKLTSTQQMRLATEIWRIRQSLQAVEEQLANIIVNSDRPTTWQRLGLDLQDAIRGIDVIEQAVE